LGKSSPTTAQAAIDWATELLSSVGVRSPEHDATLLLQAATRIPAPRIRAKPRTALTAEQAKLFAGWIDRRSRGEPVGYITGHRVFMGLDLLVDRRVLLTRPLTQAVADVALELARLRGDRNLKAADVGTGSGALALALAVLEPRFERIYASDVSADALAVARANGARYGVNDRVIWLEGDLLDPVPEQVDLIVANLPYVPASGEQASPFEPALAFYGGSDGLELLRRFAAQAPAKLSPDGALVLEVGPGQRLPVEQALLAADPDLVVEAVPQIETILIAERAYGE
jgi:release factor glutamine methyltransferase